MLSLNALNNDTIGANDMRVRLTKKTMIGNCIHLVGEIIDLGDAEAKKLIKLGKARQVLSMPRKRDDDSRDRIEGSKARQK
jgi:hypothetical protein